MSTEREQVVEQLEATIQSGSVDVQIELVGRGETPTHAQVSVSTDEADDLDLSLRDVEALHDLTCRTLALLAPASVQPPSSDQGARLIFRLDYAHLGMPTWDDATPEVKLVLAALYPGDKGNGQ